MYIYIYVDVYEGLADSLGPPQEGITAVWEMPGLAGVMRCNKQIRMQHSRASGAAHLSRCSRFCWSLTTLACVRTLVQ